jgi:RNA polymerase sigma-70 factor (ECF subfamily)
MNYHDADDELLIRACQRGDDKAFDALVTRHRARILGVARGMISDEEDAYDLAQEAFLRAYRSVKKFRGDCSPKTWLTRIVVNSCIDWQRRQKVRRGILVFFGKKEDDSPLLEEAAADPAWEADPTQVLEGTKMRDITMKTLADLPAKQRAAFVLRHFEGLDTKQLAEALECAEGTAKVHLFRATERLRVALAPFAKDML